MNIAYSEHISLSPEGGLNVNVHKNHHTAGMFLEG